MVEVLCANPECGRLLCEVSADFTGAIKTACHVCKTHNLARAFSAGFVSVVALDREDKQLRGYSFDKLTRREEKPPEVAPPARRVIRVKPKG